MIRLKFARFALCLLLVVIFVPLAHAADIDTSVTWASAPDNGIDGKPGWITCTPGASGDEVCGQYAITHHYVCLDTTKCVGNYCDIKWRCGSNGKSCNTGCATIPYGSGHINRCVCLYDATAYPNCVGKANAPGAKQVPTSETGSNVFVGLCSSCGNLLTYTEPKPAQPVVEATPTGASVIAIYEVERITSSDVPPALSADRMTVTFDSPAWVSMQFGNVLPDKRGDRDLALAKLQVTKLEFLVTVTVSGNAILVGTSSLAANSQGLPYHGREKLRVNVTLAYPLDINKASTEYGDVRSVFVPSSYCTYNNGFVMHENLPEEAEQISLGLLSDGGIVQSVSISKEFYDKRIPVFAPFFYYDSNGRLRGPILANAVSFASADAPEIKLPQAGNTDVAAGVVYVLPGEQVSFPESVIISPDGGGLDTDAARKAAALSGRLCRNLNEDQHWGIVFPNKADIALKGLIQLSAIEIKATSLDAGRLKDVVKQRVTALTGEKNEDKLRRALAVDYELSISTGVRVPAVRVTLMPTLPDADSYFYMSKVASAKLAEEFSKIEGSKPASLESVKALIGDFTDADVKRAEDSYVSAFKIGAQSPVAYDADGNGNVQGSPIEGTQADSEANLAYANVLLFARGSDYFQALFNKNPSRNWVRQILLWTHYDGKGAGIWPAEYALTATATDEQTTWTVSDSKSISLGEIRSDVDKLPAVTQFKVPLGRDFNSADYHVKIEGRPDGKFALRFNYFKNARWDERYWMLGDNQPKEGDVFSLSQQYAENDDHYGMLSSCTQSYCVLTIKRGDAAAPLPAEAKEPVTAADYAGKECDGTRGTNDQDCTDKFGEGFYCREAAVGGGWFCIDAASKKRGEYCLALKGEKATRTSGSGAISTTSSECGADKNIREMCLKVKEVLGGSEEFRCAAPYSIGLKDVGLAEGTNCFQISKEQPHTDSLYSECYPASGKASACEAPPAAAGTDDKFYCTGTAAKTYDFKRGTMKIMAKSVSKFPAQFLKPQLVKQLYVRITGTVTPKGGGPEEGLSSENVPGPVTVSATLMRTPMVSGPKSVRDLELTFKPTKEGLVANQLFGEEGLPIPNDIGGVQEQLILQLNKIEEEEATQAETAKNVPEGFVAEVEKQPPAEIKETPSSEIPPEEKPVSLSEAVAAVAGNAPIRGVSLVSGETTITATFLTTAESSINAKEYPKKQALLVYKNRPVDPALLQDIPADGEASWTVPDGTAVEVYVVGNNDKTGYAAVKAAEGIYVKPAAPEETPETSTPSENLLSVDNAPGKSSCEYSLSFESSETYILNADFQILLKNGRTATGTTQFPFDFRMEYGTPPKPIFGYIRSSDEVSGAIYLEGMGTVTAKHFQLLTSVQMLPTSFDSFYLVLKGDGKLSSPAEVRVRCAFEGGADELTRFKNQLPGLVSGISPKYKPTGSEDLTTLFLDMPGISEVKSGPTIVLQGSNGEPLGEPISFGGNGILTIRITDITRFRNDITSAAWRTRIYGWGMGGHSYGAADIWVADKPVFCKALKDLLGGTQSAIDIFMPTANPVAFNFQWVPKTYYMEASKNVAILKQPATFLVSPNENMKNLCAKGTVQEQPT